MDIVKISTDTVVEVKASTESVGESFGSKANEFFKNRSNYQVKVDSNGVTRVYDSSTNTFGSYNPDGTTNTFFKPTGGQHYFNTQPGE